MGSQKYPSKVCSKCGVSKPHTEFSKDLTRPDGLRLWCRECAKKRKKVWDQTPAGRYSAYKSNAKSMGREFDLTLEEFDHLTQQPCTFCGSTENGHRGLDRYDNSKGYTEDNVVPCCSKCNYLKGFRFTARELIDQAERIYICTHS